MNLQNFKTKTKILLSRILFLLHNYQILKKINDLFSNYFKKQY